MNIKRFQSVCRFAQVVLTILAAISLFVLLGTVFVYFFGSSSSSISMDFNIFTIASFQMNTPTKAQEEFAALLTGIPALSLYFYTLFKGSKLFDQLSEGDTPFSNAFSKQLKTISLILIASDIIAPLIYSFVLSIVMETGYFLQIHLSSDFVVGIILYCTAEVLNYGIKLQKLSDDTV